MLNKLFFGEEAFAMKRIKAACIRQILCFTPKDGIAPSYREEAVKGEVALYKRQLERNKTQYKIVSEVMEKDGSVTLEIIKQYNMAPVGNYLEE